MELKIVTSQDVSALESGQKYIAIPIGELFACVANLFAKQAAAAVDRTPCLLEAPTPPADSVSADRDADVLDEQPTSSASVDYTEACDRVLAFVSDNPGCAASFIISASKLPKPEADKLLLSMRKSGKLDTAGKRRGMRYYPVGETTGTKTS
jgi:hypothetical protein